MSWGGGGDFEKKFFVGKKLDCAKNVQLHTY